MHRNNRKEDILRVPVEIKAGVTYPKTFIGQWMIDTDICDDMIHEFQNTTHAVTLDSLRGYFRLSNRRISTSLNKRYIKAVKGVIAAYIDKYPWCKKMNEEWGFTEPYNIQMYEPGSAYSIEHLESGGPSKGKFIRHLVFTTYLNDVFDMGQTEFPCQDISIRPKKGLTVIFPAGWTHPHYGLASESEVKYISTGWCSYKNKVSR
jgi:hypothetical protein